MKKYSEPLFDVILFDITDEEMSGATDPSTPVFTIGEGLDFPIGGNSADDPILGSGYNDDGF